MPPVFAAALIVFCEGLVIWAVFPVTSYYCDDLGGGPVWVGVMFALMSAPKVMTNPIFGRLSDRFGRRPLLALASMGNIAASVGWALAPSLQWLAVSRALAGTFGTNAALSAAVVADSTDPEKRAAGMGIIGAAFGLSMIIGPLVGGVVTHFGSHAAVGWLCAAIQGVSLFTVVFLLRETHPVRSVPATQPHAPRVSLRAVLGEPGALPLLTVTLLLMFAMAQITTTLATLTKCSYGFDAEATAGIFVLFGVTATLVQGGAIRVLVPRYGERLAAMAGIICMGAGAGLMALVPPLGVLWFSMALMGAGGALTMPTITALLSRCVGRRRQGTMLGAHQSATALGRSAGALCAGQAFAWGMAVPYALAAVLALVALLVLEWSGTRDRGNGSGSPETWDIG